MQSKPQQQVAGSVEKSKQLSQEDELRKQLEDAFANRRRLIAQISRLKGRLAYKKNESEALSKLVEMNDKYKEIGRLKHLKEVLEFKISTEARTLDEEKALLKKLGDVETRFKEAITSQRLRKKAELVEQDIAQISKSIDETSAAIEQANKQIDELKEKLSAFTKPSMKPKHKQQAPSNPEPFKINLADIAVIKTKKKQGQNGDEQKPEQARS
ncbi:MAG: hypothetical protein ACP5MC_03305 [Candidatus Micrarchaeia archaeon]